MRLFIKFKYGMKRFSIVLSLLLIVLTTIEVGQYNSVHFGENLDDISKIPSLETQGIYEEEFTEEWLDNRFFEYPITPWYSTTQGDLLDLNATSSQNQANFQILGDQGTFSLVENPPSSSNWIQKNNPDFPFLPDTYAINENGFYVSHYWNEGADQSPSVHWDQNVSLSQNMSDYIITSASIDAKCNATVTTPSSQPYSDGVETVVDDADPNFQVATGDYIRFYILISDLNKENVFEIAYNQTSNLGQDSPAISTMFDTFMETIPEETLIYYLTQVLSLDYQNFTITAGIRVWCEDNFPQDSDRFNDIIINYINLTFSYVKKIDQLSTLSWNQIGNTLSGENLEISRAVLNFKYKIDKIWPIVSPNSEIRIFFNDALHSETIKLSSAITNFQDAKINGFDVTNLIQKDINISLSFELFIADNFGLEDIRTISLDNASLTITYKIIKNLEETHLTLFLNNLNKTNTGYLEIALGEILNISIIYLNTLSNFISNASVILYGFGNPKNLTESISPDNYYIILNTTNLDLGENYFSLTASKYSFETVGISLIIRVIKRASYIDNILLNSFQSNSIDLLWNSTLDIKISYNDSISDEFISGAHVQLAGTDISNNLTEGLNYYYLTINTAELNFGSNYLTINAVGDDYLSYSTYLIVNVAKRDTNLKIYVNGIDESTFEYFNATIGQVLNLTVFYQDFITDQHISNANIDLYKGTSSIGLFSENVLFKQYNYSILSDDIGNGIKTLTIIAEKVNFTKVEREVKLIIGERATELDLLLNGTLTPDNGKVTLQIGESLNVTALFQDNFTSNHLSGASLNLVGYGNFTENLIMKQYYFLINAIDLTQGFTYLTIIAELENFESHTIDIILEVIERNSEYSIFLNGINKTEDRYIELPIGSIINCTVTYFDIETGMPIEGANIGFQGDLITTLQENMVSHQYSYMINTTELDIGVSFISILFLKENFQPQSPDLTIVVRRINSSINTIGGETLLNAIPGTNYILEVKLTNEDFGGFIYNASVRYSWEFGQGILEDPNNDGIYTGNLGNLFKGTYSIVITVYAGDDYSFNRYELALEVKDPNELELNLFGVLLILFPIMAFLITGFVLYEKKYKVPKPIRKLRKYRKTLNKSKMENIHIISREMDIKEFHRKSLEKLSNLPKIKKSPSKEDGLLHKDAKILS